MRRRDFIAGLGGAAAWPIAARAQQAQMPVIGYLLSGSPEPARALIAAFHRGLAETGLVEGLNVSVEYRWARGQYDLLPALVADLVRRQVAVIATGGGTPAALAAKAATKSIPIVFEIGGDAVKLGLVEAINRPGANVTGAMMFVGSLGAKRVQLLHQVIPRTASIGVLVNPANPVTADELQRVSSAAAELGRQIRILKANTKSEVEAAFARIVEDRIGALLTAPDAFFFIDREHIVALATRHSLPALYANREFTEEGGLMSYSNSSADAYREVGAYTGRVLKGERPGDLPVKQSSRFEFVINLKTAKSLGLDIPSGVLAIADEVIE